MEWRGDRSTGRGEAEGEALGATAVDVMGVTDDGAVVAGVET